MGREDETWVAVLRCRAIREKEVWHCSSEAKARAVVRQYIDSMPGRKRLIYDPEVEITVRQLFVTTYTS